MEVVGLDFLTNTKITDAPSMGLPDLTTIELPTFDAPEQPRLIPTFQETGPLETNDGFKNYNAEPFLPPTRRMNEEHLMREKYEILRKFERLAKMGVPLRKRFTIESSLEDMKMELEFIRKEKAMDQTIKQFCDWS